MGKAASKLLSSCLRGDPSQVHEPSAAHPYKPYAYTELSCCSSGSSFFTSSGPNKRDLGSSDDLLRDLIKVPAISPAPSQLDTEHIPAYSNPRRGLSRSCAGLLVVPATRPCAGFSSAPVSPRHAHSKTTLTLSLLNGADEQLASEARVPVSAESPATSPRSLSSEKEPWSPCSFLTQSLPSSPRSTLSASLPSSPRSLTARSEPGSPRAEDAEPFVDSPRTSARRSSPGSLGARNTETLPHSPRSKDTETLPSSPRNNDTAQQAAVDTAPDEPPYERETEPLSECDSSVRPLADVDTAAEHHTSRIEAGQILLLQAYDILMEEQEASEAAHKEKKLAFEWRVRAENAAHNAAVALENASPLRRITQCAVAARAEADAAQDLAAARAERADDLRAAAERAYESARALLLGGGVGCVCEDGEVGLMLDWVESRLGGKGWVGGERDRGHDTTMTTPPRRSESVRGGNPIPHTHFTISSVLCGDNISSVCDHQDTQCESHQPLNSATHEQPTTHRVDDTQHAVTKSQSQSYQDNIDHLIEATITRALTHTAPTHMALTHTAQESGELDTSAPGSETAGTMCDLDTQQQICETICHQGSTDNTQAMRPVSQCAGKSEDTMRVCESGSSESDSESEGESESDDEEEVMILSKKAATQYLDAIIELTVMLHMGGKLPERPLHHLSPDEYDYALIQATHVHWYGEQYPGENLHVILSRLTLVSRANEAIEQLYTVWGRVPDENDRDCYTHTVQPLPGVRAFARMVRTRVIKKTFYSGEPDDYSRTTNTTNASTGLSARDDDITVNPRVPHRLSCVTY